MRIQQSVPLLRNYLPGDENALIALWNLAYDSYAGYVPRSLEYWRWCILERPGVTAQDLLILQHENEIRGYGVLGPDGIVLEFAVDPRLPARTRRKIAVHLIRALEERGRLRGDEVIRFEVPYMDEAIRRAFLATDFVFEKADESLNMMIVDLKGLLTKILSHREMRIPNGWSPTFFFKIMPGNYRFCPYDQLYIQIGHPVVIKADPGAVKADRGVDIDLSTLTDLIFRRTTFEEAMTAGCLAIHPVSGVRDVRTLMDLLTLDTPWYTPYADGR